MTVNLSPRCWKVHDKYLCSNNKAHFEQFHVYYQKCNSCPHDRAHCGNLIMEREASKLFPWRCNVCAQTEFMDKTGRYKTEDLLCPIFAHQILYHINFNKPGTQ
ncbi:hypothetical protein BGZ92_004532 [Podila epicladia]|nr:hypothetical protein BGZ92_004532 [Podila epicladia]